MAAPVTSDHVALVRAIWQAYASGDVERMRELAGPDVDWVPLSEGRPVTSAAVYGDWGRRQARKVSATVHGYESHGSCVLVHGSLRIFRDRGLVDVQPSWVYFFRDGRLVRAVGYTTREEALRAIAEFTAAA